MKNKLLMSIIVIIALVLCVSIVSAAVTVTGTYNKDNPTFGGTDQEASNSRSNDDDDNDNNDDDDVYFKGKIKDDENEREFETKHVNNLWSKQGAHIPHPLNNFFVFSLP